MAKEIQPNIYPDSINGASQTEEYQSVNIDNKNIRNEAPKFLKF